MNKKTKIIFSIVGLLVIIFIILIPYLKLWVYYYHYELIGSYIIMDMDDFDREKIGIDIDNPIHINKISYETDKNIEITNVLYYKDLKQLSFGFITNKNKGRDYELIIMNKDGNELGGIFTAGTRDYYNKSIEKILCLLNENLLANEEYMIQIKDIEKNIVGTVKIALPNE